MIRIPFLMSFTLQSSELDSSTLQTILQLFSFHSLLLEVHLGVLLSRNPSGGCRILQSLRITPYADNPHAKNRIERVSELIRMKLTGIRHPRILEADSQHLLLSTRRCSKAVSSLQIKLYMHVNTVICCRKEFCLAFIAIF
jgi:hypothetical protein